MIRIHWERTANRADLPSSSMQGLGLSSRFWFDQPERLSKRGARHHARQSRHRTAATNRDGRIDLPQMADDVARVIREANAGPAIVVGISMGGMIAQHVAMRHPKRRARARLIATSPDFHTRILPAPSALGWLAPRAARAKRIRAPSAISIGSSCRSTSSIARTSTSRDGPMRWRTIRCRCRRSCDTSSP